VWIIICFRWFIRKRSVSVYVSLKNDLEKDLEKDLKNMDEKNILSRSQDSEDLKNISYSCEYLLKVMIFLVIRQVKYLGMVISKLILSRLR